MAKYKIRGWSGLFSAHVVFLHLKGIKNTQDYLDLCWPLAHCLSQRWLKSVLYQDVPRWGPRRLREGEKNGILHWNPNTTCAFLESCLACFCFPFLLSEENFPSKHTHWQTSIPGANTRKTLKTRLLTPGAVMKWAKITACWAKTTRQCSGAVSRRVQEPEKSSTVSQPSRCTLLPK